MTPKSAIAKGKILEQYVCDQIRDKGIDPKAYRSHGSGNGNSEKSDVWTSMMVLGQNIGLECKNQSTLHIPDWWRQTKKLESLGREPVLVFKQFGEPLSETKTVIYLDTFLELCKHQSNSPPKPQNEPTGRERLENGRLLAFALNQLKIALNKVIKLLENETN